MSFLEVRNISKSFEQQEAPAVKQVSLSLEQGQIAALIGSSGSGKTTLLRIIAGLLDADKGEVLLEGERVLGPSEQLVAGHAQIRLLAQAFDLSPKLKVHENLRFFLLKWPKQKQNDRVEELLALCGLEGMENRYPRELSGGQQQRLALGRALADSPELLLLDEPFSHLDSHLRHSMRESLYDLLRDTHTTVLMVTHDPQDALYIAHTASVIQEGELIQTGTPRQVYEHPKNIYAAQFFGRPNIIATEEINKWPTSPQYPSQHSCCLREWDIHPSDAGIAAVVLKITFLTGFYEIELGIQGSVVRMNLSKPYFSQGEIIHVNIDWAKCQLLLSERGM